MEIKSHQFQLKLRKWKTWKILCCVSEISFYDCMFVLLLEGSRYFFTHTKFNDVYINIVEKNNIASIPKEIGSIKNLAMLWLSE